MGEALRWRWQIGHMPAVVECGCQQLHICFDKLRGEGGAKLRFQDNWEQEWNFDILEGLQGGGVVRGTL